MCKSLTGLEKQRCFYFRLKTLNPVCQDEGELLGKGFNFVEILFHSLLFGAYRSLAPSLTSEAAVSQ